jgi:hypothetical protein
MAAGIGAGDPADEVCAAGSAVEAANAADAPRKPRRDRNWLEGMLLRKEHRIDCVFQSNASRVDSQIDFVDFRV